MSLDTIMQLFKLVTGHQWMPLAIAVVGLLVSWTGDTTKFPVNIPARFQPLISLLLGQLYGALEAVYGGSTWTAAIGHGIMAALSSMGFANLLVNVIFNGTLPKWLAWLSFLDPNLVQAKAAGKKLSRNVFGRKKVLETAPAA